LRTSCQLVRLVGCFLKSTIKAASGCIA